ncbi:hypothetical protein RUM44_005725 [Polyplax serrata]|uniref:Uncharacterized protein n=1 Tax=Polyplax serrata TaxID=468196 RepID=A0ABR1AWC9_POLSC
MTVLLSIEHCYTTIPRFALHPIPEGLEEKKKILPFFRKIARLSHIKLITSTALPRKTIKPVVRNDGQILMNQRYTCSLIQEFKSTNIVTNSELGRRREDGGVRNIHKEQRYETPRFRTLRLKLNTTKSQIFKFTKECYVGVCRLQVKSSDCVALSSLQTWYKLSAVELWKLLRV